jgi:fucose 4-O-acetylase-like acetyltransferase
MSSTVFLPGLARHALPTAAPVATEAPKRRDPWLDNAKMVLVTLVVVGHAWTLLPATPAGSALYDFLYLWHVPAFVMVTGYLSRSFTYSRRSLSRLLTTVALPYLIFEGIMAAFRTYIGGERLEQVFLDPHWPMWYLSVLFIWRLATPVLQRLPGSLPAAVAVCLVGGLTPGDTLDVARAMGLLPFFVLGLCARPEHLELLRRPAAVRAAAVLMLAALGASVAAQGHLVTEWLYWRSSYAELGVTFGEGVVRRSLLLLVGTALALAYLSLVPRGRSWLTRLAPATLVVYLFHGFAVKVLEYAGFSSWAAGDPISGLVLTTLGAVALALALAAPTVSSRLNVVIDPVGTVRGRLAAGRPMRAQNWSG